MKNSITFAVLMFLPTLLSAQSRWVSLEELRANQHQHQHQHEFDSYEDRELKWMRHQEVQRLYGASHRRYSDHSHFGPRNRRDHRRFSYPEPVWVREKVCDRVFVSHSQYDHRYGYVDPYGYRHGSMDRDGGRVLAGAALGAAVGRQFGDGSGRDAATVIGALAGAHIAQRSRRDSYFADRDRPRERGYWTKQCYWTWNQRY